MKTVSKLFLSLCLVMGLGAVVAHAQLETDIAIEANIPHAFIVRDTALPAGTYTIKVADQGNPNVLEIRSADGRTSVLFDTEIKQANRTPGKSELVFNQMGDTSFLSQVFVEGNATGNQLPKSKMEQRLEGQGLKSEKHSVAAQKK